MAEKNPLGATGRTVAMNVRRFREQCGLSYAELARILEIGGHSIATLGLSHIEKGKRRVDVDDLLALCRALQVNPNALLLDPSVGPDDDVGMTAFGERKARHVWRWLDGEINLTDLVNDPKLFTARVRPSWRVIDFESNPVTDELRTMRLEFEGLRTDILVRLKDTTASDGND